MLMRKFWKDREPAVKIKLTYVIGICINGVGWLVVFRLQQGYARYWEAASAVFGMMSQWMEAVIQTASHHMEWDHYQGKIKPPSYYDNESLNHQFLTRERESGILIKRIIWIVMPCMNTFYNKIFEPRRLAIVLIRQLRGGIRAVLPLLHSKERSLDFDDEESNSDIFI